ncbi:MAG: heavy metal translocating P-type ATPase [Verrucomicrobiales bacterium]|jgi:Cd2+/Zn2+-exporting ATPase|nr:heavy metal translocating P-type ATPase [Verrucomicrobiales bacterium]
MNSDQNCLLEQVSDTLLADQGLRAIWLDSKGKKVSFAYQAGMNAQAADRNLRNLFSRHAPLEPRTCTSNGNNSECVTCNSHHSTSLPAGLRLVAMPDGGLMLEKESCSTAPRFWKWHQFAWVQEVEQGLLKNAHEEDLDEWKHDMGFAAICGVFVLAGFLLEKILVEHSPWAIACYVIGFIAGAWHPLEEAIEKIHERVLDVHFLMLCVAVGAAVIGHWWEGGVLLFLFSSSGALEELAMARTKREIDSLFKDAPKEATAVISGKEQRIPVEQITRGMTLRVRPGEQFAVDAEILNGTTAVNESSLTGESIPVDKSANDQVFSGTMNLWGSVDCVATKAVSESSLAKIIKLIQEAQESKAPSQRFTDKFSSGYTYLILSLCTLMFFVWWLAFGHAPFFDADGDKSAFYRAMTLLVVASPCALVLSIPSAILAGIAAGARRGVLFRGGAAIEKLAEIKRVALDKTGTLTTGELDVIAIETIPASRENDLLQIAAALGHNSTHPVSRAIARHFRNGGGQLPDVRDFRSITGFGVSGRINDHVAQLGRRSLFKDDDWLKQFPEPEIGVTETLIEAGELKGRILLRDSIREASAPLLAELQADKLHVTMLTGDRPEAAEKVAEHLGLKEFRAGLKPEDKVAAIQQWEKSGEHVAMVGDGVNDAPSLAAAHVAVGMGLRGSDAVLEQADIILTQDKLENFKYAYDLSTKASRIIKQNLVISLGVLGVLSISALGSWIPLTLGVIGHEGSTVVVVLNSLRLLFFSDKKK